MPCASNRPVGSVNFRHADATAAVQDPALRPDLAGLNSDGADERYLELERRAAIALFEHRLDGKAHAAIEKRRRETAMHRSPWIEVSVSGIERDCDPAAFGFHHVIAQSFREGV